MSPTNPYSDDDSDDSTDYETDPNRISAGLIGELIMGELPFWDIGVCRVGYNEERHQIIVEGDNGHLIQTVECQFHRTRSPIDGEDVVDVELVASIVNTAIQREMDELHGVSPQEAVQAVKEAAQRGQNMTEDTNQ